MTIRARVHHALEGHHGGLSGVLRWFLATLIVVNVAAVVVETVPAVRASYSLSLYWLEVVSVAIFSVEYVLRLWSAGEHARFAGLLGRARWVVTPGALVDLLAVAPALFLSDMRVVRILRLSRLVRIAKLGRYSLALRTLRRVLVARLPDLMSLSFVLLILLVLSSSLMFLLEREAQPDKFSSIPATMWWGIVTLTTIGYGDMAPITVEGRMLGSLVAILGLGMFALPADLLGGAFVEELGKARRLAREHRAAAGRGDAPCPHCGRAPREDEQDPNDLKPRGG